MDGRLSHPSNALFSGPTQVGKSTAVIQLILRSGELYDPPPTSVAYCYGEEQLQYDQLKKDSPIPVTFYAAFNRDIYDSLPRGCLLVLDDIVHNLPIDLLNDIAVKGTHHRDVSLICIVHNIFQKSLRTVSLNTQFFFLFKNCRDVVQVKVLGTQFGVGQQFMLSAYKDATREPHDFLFIDARPTTPDHLRFRSNIFKTPITVYVPKDA